MCDPTAWPLASTPSSEEFMPLSPDLLAILACPVCKADLKYDPDAQTFTCEACRLRFKVVDDIPNFLVEEAEKF